jgi:hypothetical protein
LAEERRNSLLDQRWEIDKEIESFTSEQKRLKADSTAKQKSFMEEAKALKEQIARKRNWISPLLQ